MVHEVHGSRRVPILRSILVGAGDLGTQSQHGRRIHENPSRLADFGGRALCHFYSPCLHHDKRFSDDLRRVLSVLALHDILRDDTDAENGGSCGMRGNKELGSESFRVLFSRDDSKTLIAGLSAVHTISIAKLRRVPTGRAGRQAGSTIRPQGFFWLSRPIFPRSSQTKRAPAPRQIYKFSLIQARTSAGVPILRPDLSATFESSRKCLRL